MPGGALYRVIRERVMWMGSSAGGLRSEEEMGEDLGEQRELRGRGRMMMGKGGGGVGEGMGGGMVEGKFRRRDRDEDESK